MHFIIHVGANKIYMPYIANIVIFISTKRSNNNVLRDRRKKHATKKVNKWIELKQSEKGTTNIDSL